VGPIRHFVSDCTCAGTLTGRCSSTMFRASRRERKVRSALDRSSIQLSGHVRGSARAGPVMSLREIGLRSKIRILGCHRLRAKCWLLDSGGRPSLLNDHNRARRRFFRQLSASSSGSLLRLEESKPRARLSADVLHNYVGRARLGFLTTSRWDNAGWTRRRRLRFVKKQRR